MPGEITEKIFLEGITKHMDDRDVIRCSQHGFTKGKLCLNILVTFYNGVTPLVDKEKATDLIYLNFCEAFDIIKSENHRVIES